MLQKSKIQDVRFLFCQISARNGEAWFYGDVTALKTDTILFSTLSVTDLCLSDGDGGEWGVVSGHGLWAGAKATLEPDGEAVLFCGSQADGGCFLHVCAGLACCHDTQHCGGDAVQGWGEWWKADEVLNRHLSQEASWFARSYRWRWRISVRNLILEPEPFF